MGLVDKAGPRILAIAGLDLPHQGAQCIMARVGAVAERNLPERVQRAFPVGEPLPQRIEPRTKCRIATDMQRRPVAERMFEDCMAR
jgi:hypothetical protein